MSCSEIASLQKGEQRQYNRETIYRTVNRISLKQGKRKTVRREALKEKQADTHNK